MKRLIIVLLGLALPTIARAQTTTPVLAATSPGVIASTAPQAAPQAAAAAVQTPAAPQTPAATPAAASTEPLRSLFENNARQFQIGGRFSSIDGDPARYQRYQDLGDGLLFTDARYERGDADGNWFFHAAADKVGWTDQRYIADYQRVGRYKISGIWDEIPQFYSVDTKTPYTSTGSPLGLSDSIQSSIQNGQATLSAYLPAATQFDLKERRDVGHVGVSAALTPSIEVRADYTTTRHRGELPFGASFGFSNDVEVALPYDSRTNDVTLGAEWVNPNQKNMLRVGYTGSWFNNLDETLVWDSPLRLDDNFDAGPSRGRMSLWPSNSAQTFTAGGYTKLAHRTQVTGFISYGLWTNDEPLQPFTINASLPQLPLPRATTQGEAGVFSTNLNLTSRPINDWHFTGRVRIYDFNNHSPQTSIPQLVSYDDAVSTSSTGGPELYAHNRATYDADASWTGLAPVALGVGYTRNNNGYDFRIFDSTGENVLRLTADAIGSQWVSFRAEYEYANRNGSGLNEDILVEVGEQPAMRHYDLADRTRNKFTGQVDLVPNDLWTVSLSAGVGQDDFPGSDFGLQETTFRTFSAGADYRLPSGLGGGGSYNFERYFGLQRSRSAKSDTFTDPDRDWTADSVERVHYFSIYATPPNIGANTEARLSYDFSHAEGSYLYGVVPGGPLPEPSQLPNVFNKLQQLHVDVRHRLTERLAASVSYQYEQFRVFDFAFDPTVVDSIIQPSSLVLGYVYRPYTAHSAQVGLRYFW